MNTFQRIATPVVLTLVVLFSGAVAAEVSGDDPLAKRLAMVHTLLFDSRRPKRVAISKRVGRSSINQSRCCMRRLGW